MSRRPLAVALAGAAAGAALVATPASADATCVSTTDRPFTGTYVCVARNSATSGTTYVPYYVGPVCVGGVCTAPVSGTIPVPKVNGQVVHVYGSICVTVKVTTCRPFDSAIIGHAITLPPLQ